MTLSARQSIKELFTDLKSYLRNNQTFLDTWLSTRGLRSRLSLFHEIFVVQTGKTSKTFQFSFEPGEVTKGKIRSYHPQKEHTTAFSQLFVSHLQWKRPSCFKFAQEQAKGRAKREQTAEKVSQLTYILG
jgi:hypothetical protein